MPYACHSTIHHIGAPNVWPRRALVCVSAAAFVSQRHHGNYTATWNTLVISGVIHVLKGATRSLAGSTSTALISSHAVWLSGGSLCKLAARSLGHQGSNARSLSRNEFPHLNFTSARNSRLLSWIIFRSLSVPSTHPVPCYVQLRRFEFECRLDAWAIIAVSPNVGGLDLERESHQETHLQAWFHLQLSECFVHLLCRFLFFFFSFPGAGPAAEPQSCSYPTLWCDHHAHLPLGNRLARHTEVPVVTDLAPGCSLFWVVEKQ